MSLQDCLLAEFRAAKGLKAHITVAAEALKLVADLSDKAAAVKEINTVLNVEIGTHLRNQTSVVLEGDVRAP